MVEKIRFSEHVIDCLNKGDFRFSRDSYAGTRIGFYQEDENADDFWELWAWGGFFPWSKPTVSLRRRGKFLNHLTIEEEKALYAAMESATVEALAREARYNERQRMKREADHWWP